MIEHGLQRSTVRPEEIEITETRVFAASDISTVTEPETDGQPGFSGYEFTLTEYGKDEYIRIQAERNQTLEDELTNTQVALCEVYELMA